MLTHNENVFQLFDTKLMDFKNYNVVKKIVCTSTTKSITNYLSFPGGWGGDEMY